MQMSEHEAWVQVASFLIHSKNMLLCPCIWDMRRARMINDATESRMLARVDAERERLQIPDVFDTLWPIGSPGRVTFVHRMIRETWEDAKRAMV